MTSPLHLTDPDDATLNAVFAEHVAKMTPSPKNPGLFRTMSSGDGYNDERPPHFTASADAVLGHLENCLSATCENLIGGWRVRVCYRGELTPANPLGHCHAEHMDKSFAKAAVLALLRSKGAQVEFTK